MSLVISDADLVCVGVIVLCDRPANSIEPSGNPSVRKEDPKNLEPSTFLETITRLDSCTDIK